MGDVLDAADVDENRSVSGKLYTYPTENYFETVPSEVITHIISKIDQDSYEAMLLR